MRGLRIGMTSQIRESILASIRRRNERHVAQQAGRVQALLSNLATGPQFSTSRSGNGTEIATLGSLTRTAGALRMVAAEPRSDTAERAV